MRFTVFLCICLALSMIFTPIIKPVTEKETRNVQKASAQIKEDSEDTVTLIRSESGKKITLSMSDYIIGVVSAEISPLYSEEAIKAQAVASHTYALYQQRNNVTLTDDYKKHQAYISPEEAKEKWGEKYEIYSKKITSAVSEVKDKIITYDSEIILPAFFALCSGKTENCEDIWGGKVPYLVSVTSTGDTLSSDLTSEAKFTEEEFKSKIEASGNITLNGKAENWVTSLESTQAGAVKKITVCEKDFTGSEIQSMFALKSNNFTVKYADNCFVFTVTGNGHGVGMSQYGADFMARQGSNYEEILKHYYTGVEIESL